MVDRVSQHRHQTSSDSKPMDSILTSPVIKSFLGGSISGTLSAVLFQPLDLVKTRVQLSVNIGTSPGIFGVVSSVIEKERLIGLWKGVAPSLSRCVPGVGLYFASLHWLQSNFGSHDRKALESLAMGATARSFSGVAVLPFTVIKTRYESGQYRYSSISRALIVIYRTEGLRGLYCGLAPTLLRDVPFSSIYLTFFTQLKKRRPEGYLDEHFLPFYNFLCGVIAGMIASVITQPADVIKTHSQMDPALYGSIPASMAHVYKKDGILGFWRGVIPRTMRRTLIAAMTWTIYEELMRYCGIKT